MQPESPKLLADMLDATNAIRDFSTGKVVGDLSTDKLLRAAIYFQFVVIGEALTQLRQKDLATAGQITEYARIIAFRNQVIHGYAKIDDEITWRIIESKLPVLHAELQKLLNF